MNKKLLENEVSYLVTKEYINKVIASTSKIYPKIVRDIITLLFLSFVLLFAFIQSFNSVSNSDVIVNMLYILVPLFTIFTISMVFVWVSKKMLEISLGGIGTTGKVIFNDNNIVSENNGLDSKIAYSAITKAVITKDVIFLVFKNKISAIVPLPATSNTIKLTKKYINIVIDRR